MPLGHPPPPKSGLMLTALKAFTSIGKAEDGKRLFLLVGEKVRLRASVTTIFHSWSRSSGPESQSSSPVFLAPWRLGAFALKFSPLKSGAKDTRSPNASRLPGVCESREASGAFTVAFGIERLHTFGVVIFISRFVRAD